MIRRFRDAIYGWGRRNLPIRWRRSIRRRLPVERLFGIQKREPEVPRLPPAPREKIPGRPDVIVLPAIEWSFRRQRPQQLSLALASLGGRVFYATFDGGAPAAVAEGVILFPVAGARREDLHDRSMGEGDLSSADAALDSLSEEFGIREAVFLVEAPYWRPLAMRARERRGWKVAYDCIDDHGAFSTTRKEFVQREEAALAESADCVFASSDALREKMSAVSKNVSLLRNAGDFEFFSYAAIVSKRGDSPRIGYFGAVADWFDVSLVAEIARRRPDWQFEIIGSPYTSRLDLWKGISNISARGEVSYETLPQELARFDVAVIPFLINALTRATDPVKVYEMLASGRPVVSTPLPELRRLEMAGLVRLADGAAAFERAIGESLRENDPAQRAGRIEFARENTWRHRARQLRSRLRALYPRTSVIVVTYENLALNQACLDSIRRSTEWPNLEVIAIDNGSTDGTAEWLAEESKRDPEFLRVIFNAENRGFAPAVNQGVAASTGEYLCLLNNDTVVSQGWLSTLTGHLVSDARLGMVGPSTNEIANEARVSVGYAGISEMAEWARDFIRRNLGRLEPIPMLAMFCVALRRSLWDRIGPLDERFTVGMFEDDDYSRRVRDAGFEIAVARDAFVHHRGRASFDRLGEERYLQIYRENEERYRRKWGDDHLPAFLRDKPGVIVFLPSIGWNVTLVQRPHALARALARAGRPVVFDCTESSVDHFCGFREIEPRLYLYRGPSETLKELDAPVLWAFAYNVPELSRWRGARLVYDIIDDPGIFPHPPGELARNHRKALQRASAIFAVSRPLLNEARSSRADALYLPNACDPEIFGSLPSPIPARSRPVAGYVGALARWFDYELLAAVARRLPGWDFLLIGEELDDSFRKSPARSVPNVVFEGSRPHRELPSAIAGFDAGIICFRQSRETAAISPVKLYEYFAAGKPVVSTPMPEAESFPEVIVARDAEGFASALERARRLASDAKFVERLGVLAGQNSWAARAGTILLHLEAGQGEIS